MKYLTKEELLLLVGMSTAIAVTVASLLIMLFGRVGYLNRDQTQVEHFLFVSPSPARNESSNGWDWHD